MTDEILFLPLDANPDLIKGPQGIRPSAGARKPPGGGGPVPKQPKLGAAGAPSGGAKVPKANKPAVSMPSAKAPNIAAAGGQEFDYVPGDRPMPAGAQGKTSGGNWKVPKGAGGVKTAAPKDPEAEKPELEKPGMKDPLSGAKIDESDKKIKDAAAAVDPHAKTMADPKKPTVDPFSTDRDSYKDAHPAVHYAMSDKFREDGDDKMAEFHEGMAKEKSDKYSPQDHADAAEALTKLGMHDHAKKHADKAQATPAAAADDPAAVDVSTLDSKKDDGQKVPLMITKNQHQQLADLGYSKEQRKNMKPEEAHAAIKDGKKSPDAGHAQEVKDRNKRREKYRGKSNEEMEEHVKGDPSDFEAHQEYMERYNHSQRSDSDLEQKVIDDPSDFHAHQELTRRDKTKKHSQEVKDRNKRRDKFRSKSNEEMEEHVKNDPSDQEAHQEFAERDQHAQRSDKDLEQKVIDDPSDFHAHQELMRRDKQKKDGAGAKGSSSKPSIPRGPNGERYDLERFSPEWKAATAQRPGEHFGAHRRRLEKEHGYVSTPARIDNKHPAHQDAFNARREKVHADWAENEKAHRAKYAGKDGPVADAKDPAAVDVSSLDSEDVDLSDLEAKDGDPAKTPVADLDNRHSSKTKAALSEHKEAGAKAAKELSSKHAEKERALKDGHKKREGEIKDAHAKATADLHEHHANKEKDLKAKHSEREKASVDKHAAKMQKHTENYESKTKELEGKHEAKHKELIDSHRKAQDDHAAATRKASTLTDPAKKKAAQTEIAAHKKSVVDSKRKLDDHKAGAKAKMAEHHESYAKTGAAHAEAHAAEMAAHKTKHAEELKAHKEVAKFSMNTHKAGGAHALEMHKQASEKELVDHATNSSKEMDAHQEAHGKQGKELQSKHEQAVGQDKHESKQRQEQQKTQAKEQQKAQKEQETAKKQADKAAGKDAATAQANERKPPSNPHEEMQNAAHRAKAKKVADNIDSHLKNPELAPHDKERLQKTRAMLDDHINSPHVPTPEMQQQMKDVEQAAGEHGKKAHEGADDGAKKPPGGGQQTHSGLGLKTLSHAWNTGAQVGGKLGSAAASPYAGALGQHVVSYGTTGAASAGHYLLNRTVPTESEGSQATAEIASKRHEAAQGSGAATSKDSSKDTESVSANKSIRLYVRL